MGYTKAAFTGISWVALLRIGIRGLSFVKTIYLARILSPSQFGIYGIAFMVLGFLEMMTETGVNVILIQEREVKKYLSSAFIVSIARGLLISCIIIVLTPHICSFFNAPRASTLLYLVSIVPLLRGFINPGIITFQKDLQFNKEFLYRISIFIVDTFFAIYVTYLLRDPIGIIWGQIAGVMFEIILSYIIVPVRPHFSLRSEYVALLVNRGKWITASGIFNYLFHNADNIVVGKLLGSSALGTYQMAYSISMLPITEIADVFSRVTFPIFAKIREDKKRLQKAFYKMFGIVTLLTITLGSILYIFANDLVILFLGSKWQGVIPVLQILALFSTIRTISGYTASLFLAVGKQKYVTVVTLVSLLGLLLPIIPLCMMYGLVGIAYAVVAGSVLAFPVYLYYTLKVLYKDETS